MASSIASSTSSHTVGAVELVGASPEVASGVEVDAVESCAERRTRRRRRGSRTSSMSEPIDVAQRGIEDVVEAAPRAAPIAPHPIHRRPTLSAHHAHRQ